MTLLRNAGTGHNRSVDEIGLTTITTEGNEMRLSGFVIAPQTAWHEQPFLPQSIVVPRLAPKIGARTWGTGHRHRVTSLSLLSLPHAYRILPRPI
jgi:hypothetical protein